MDPKDLELEALQTQIEVGFRDLQFAYWILVTGLYAWLIWGLPSIWLPFVDFVRSQSILVAIIVTLILPVGVPLIISQTGLCAVSIYLRRRELSNDSESVNTKAQVISGRTLFFAFIIVLVFFLGSIVLEVRTNDASVVFRGIYLGISMAFAFIYLVVGFRTKIRRYYLIPFVGAGGTISIAFMPVQVGMYPFIVSIFWAVMLTMSSIFVFLTIGKKQKQQGIDV
ncbi:MAG: hypothetical protein DWQ07_00965 [Chloroflexi bacterium]|nr:MAG: hypothetical protein DWQ07_00965 [Chloroflexota bacterium]MBL1196547.1 hypothetical protein [Chloroflexota bacterium]NOH13842.1 hypothetical protein [Chloroflexota bacterium]